MAREPTAKSRTAAFAGVTCILLMYVIVGWFSSPVSPMLVVPLAVTVAVAFMFMAKDIREREGPELRIPISIRSRVMVLSNLEVALALACGVSTMVVVGMIYAGTPKTIQRIAILASMSCFVAGGISNFLIFRRYHELLATLDASNGC